MASPSSWRQELERYTSLNGFPYATPLRRESAALIALGLFLYVTRRQRRERTLVNLPATMLAAALALLVLTPSKFPWHFGALTGLVALTIGAEVARIRRDGSEARGWQIRPYLITARLYRRHLLGVVSPRFLESVRSPHAQLDTSPRRGSFLHHSCPRDSGRRFTAAMVMSVLPSRRLWARGSHGDSRHGRFRSSSSR